MKNRKFLTGFTFTALLLLLSVLYSIYLDAILPKPPEMIYGENHILLDAPPYPPGIPFIFGVDRFGGDVFWMVIDGAKYTVTIAMSAAILRVAFSVFGSIFYILYLGNLTFIIESFIRAIRFIPAVILAMIFFISSNTPDVSAGWLLGQQLIILVFIGVVPLMGFLGAEVRVFMDSDFISCSRTLGASKWWLIKHHILKHLQPRAFVLFTQQVVQTLLLLVHLGVFQILIGKIKEVTKFDGLYSGEKVTMSLTNEWSGLIGLSYHELMLDKWIILGPCIGFTLTIYAFRLMGKGLEEVLADSASRGVRVNNSRQLNKALALTKEPFELLYKENRGKI
ncbi:ABC transporter permease subunit [Bacillus salacetis]|nr:ABC transporter permease subunit [Bacillus salacetis]